MVSGISFGQTKTEVQTRVNDTLRNGIGAGNIKPATLNYLFTGILSNISNVSNTSDPNKPISTATQTALNAKQNTITQTDFVKNTSQSGFTGNAIRQIVRLTQGEYDSLGTKDPNTLYLTIN